MIDSPIWPAEGERPSLMEPPSRSGADYAHTAAKVGLNLIPNFGGALAELFVLAVAAPLEKRRDDWIRRIAEGLEDLQQRFEGFDPKQLPDNEAFVSTAYQATQAFMRTHYEDKREALTNAVLNSAVRTDVDEELQQVFVGLVDTLTPWHLRLLRLFEDPPRALASLGGDVERRAASFSSMSELIHVVYPELGGQRERYEQLGRELNAHGLLGVQSFGTMMTPNGVIAKRTTPLGDSFLRFITTPQPTAVAR